MVFIGRAQTWGSIYNNTHGVLNVLDILRNEFVNTAIMTGSPTLQHINRDMIVNPFDTERAPEKECLTSGASQVKLPWIICILIFFLAMWSEIVLSIACVYLSALCQSWKL